MLLHRLATLLNHPVKQLHFVAYQGVVHLCLECSMCTTAQKIDVLAEGLEIIEECASQFLFHQFPEALDKVQIGTVRRAASLEF